MSADEVQEKFMSLARTVKDERSVHSILKLYPDLEELKDLSKLITLLE